MKKYLLFGLCLSFLFISCEKEEQPLEEPTIEELLTQKVWKAEQIRVQFKTGVYEYYKRGESNSTLNYDSDSLRFNIDNTGRYYYQGAAYNTTWEFTNVEKDKLKLVISRPEGPENISWENVNVSSSQLRYVQFPTSTSLYLSSVSRIPN